MKEQEYPLLREFLYEAIFVPEDMEPPSKEILDLPELQVYFDDFGYSEHDNALVAEIDGEVVGAVWSRIMDDYGHIDDSTPSISIALYKEYRKQGIGASMMKEILTLLKRKGYAKVSLSVEKKNYAIKLYQRLGFQVFDTNEEDYVMVLYLNSTQENSSYFTQRSMKRCLR